MSEKTFEVPLVGNALDLVAFGGVLAATALAMPLGIINERALAAQRRREAEKSTEPLTAFALHGARVRLKPVPTGARRRTDALQATFENLAAVMDPSRERIRVRIGVRREGVTRSWSLTMGQEGCEAAAGLRGRPDLDILVTDSAWWRIAQGLLDPLTAHNQGALHFEGDPGKAAEVLKRIHDAARAATGSQVDPRLTPARRPASGSTGTSARPVAPELHRMRVRLTPVRRSPAERANPAVDAQIEAWRRTTGRIPATG